MVGQGHGQHREGEERMLMLAEVHCHCADSHLRNREHGEKGHNWDHQLGSVPNDAGAPYGSAHLPAERPIGACSLWRTPLGPGGFSHLRVRTTQAPGSKEVTGATNS